MFAAIPPRIPGDNMLKALTVEKLVVEDMIVAPSFVIVPKESYTQLTSATTAVPIETTVGTVTTFALTTATTASTVFTLTGDMILADSVVMLTPVAYSGVPLTAGIPMLFATSVAEGIATITISNAGANALAGTMTFNYMVV